MFSGVFRIQSQRYGIITILSTENKIIFKSQLLITKFTMTKSMAMAISISMAMAMAMSNSKFKIQN
jgi:hypothetical protein